MSNKSSFTKASVSGTIRSVTVTGDGQNHNSAELLILFVSDTGIEETLRLGVGAAAGHFMGTCAVALAAYQNKIKVTISATTIAGKTPEVLSIQIGA
jgi:hypothetical protein